MKKYALLNNSLGWFVGIAASIIYIMTAEPTASFWDCGEFITCAYKLEVGHPPGAPTFNLLGRIVSLLAFGDVSKVAWLINCLSAVSSGLSVMFIFWITTYFIKRFFGKNEDELETGNMYAVLGGGLVGAFAFAFCDSFWFSAVEAEVYGMAGFFTAMIFWAATRWEREPTDAKGYRWIILIAYLIGFSIGVHLLNLLAIPAMGYLYYYKKYKNPTVKGVLITTVVSLAITGSLLSLIIPKIISLFASFELLFVNVFGLPFNSGSVFFALLIVALIVFGLRYSIRKAKPMLNTLILCFTFLLIGYSTYMILIIRSNANTPINENAPKNAISLLSYMNREQYGDWPIMYGPYYNAPTNPQSEWKDGNPVYARNDQKGEYVVIDKREKSIPTYNPDFCTIFPRMWNSNEGHPEGYKSWGSVKGVPVSYTDPETQQTETIYKPTFFENIKYFLSYQVGHMYMRYLLWNFVGKQNDIQNVDNNPLEGNWYSGITFIDELRLGPQGNLPYTMKNNKGMNKFYFLPLILGFIGFFYQLNKRANDSLVVMMFFFMTGIAIILYLNQYPNQPRERDYAYAGSLMAFSIWIGIGVVAVYDLFRKKLKPVHAAVAATAICFLCVPYVMGKEGWDDHNRSGRRTMIDFATNYLNSCAPNAIIFTNGDNDTFPLWYAQEVEGIRTDVRVVNLSLLNTDWYINSMKSKAYDSDPVPISMGWDQYKEGTRDYVYFIPDTTICPNDKYFNLKLLMDFVASDDPNTKFQSSTGSVEYFPTKNFSIPVDKKLVLENGTVPAKLADSIVPAIQWTVGRYGVQKSDLMLLDILANNNWKRPIYFASTSGSSTFLGLNNYLYLEGLAYRLMPVKNSTPVKGEVGSVNTDAMYANMMTKFNWGNMQDTSLYFDETVIGMALSLRLSFSRLADALSDEGRKEMAVKVLDKCQAVFPERNVQYNYYEYFIGNSYYKAGAMDKGNKVMSRIIDRYSEDLKYYFSFKGANASHIDYFKRQALSIIQNVMQSATNYKQDAVAKKAQHVFDTYFSIYSK